MKLRPDCIPPILSATKGVSGRQPGWCYNSSRHPSMTSYTEMTLCSFYGQLNHFCSIRAHDTMRLTSSAGKLNIKRIGRINDILLFTNRGRWRIIVGEIFALQMAREHPQDKAQKFVIIDEISIENVIIKWPGYLYCKKR
jgi:hypothetical protein